MSIIRMHLERGDDRVGFHSRVSLEEDTQVDKLRSLIWSDLLSRLLALPICLVTFYQFRHFRKHGVLPTDEGDVEAYHVNTIGSMKELKSNQV